MGNSTSNTKVKKQHNSKSIKIDITTRESMDKQVEQVKVLCFNHHSYIGIDDKFINSIFRNNSFTLECWALPNRDLINYKNNMMLFGQKSNSENGANYAMHFGIFNFTQIGMRYNYNDINIDMQNNSLQGYHHYAFVYNHLTKKREIFFDGLLIGSDITNSNLLSSENFMIGGSPWNKNDDWGGTIRDVRIWNIARLDTEIRRDYNIICRNVSSLKCIFEEYITLISECRIFVECFKDFPREIIQIVVSYDGCGLVACFPLVDDVASKDTETVTDIVSGIEGQLNGPIFWKKQE